MKANELRIGNILHSNLTERNFICNAEDIYNLSMEYNSENAKPIPLTEEWLLNFGFKLNHENFNWNAAIGTNEIGDFKLSLRYTESIGWFYRSKCTPVKYVHQLQNLYFALTGEELVIKN